MDLEFVPGPKYVAKTVKFLGGLKETMGASDGVQTHN